MRFLFFFLALSSFLAGPLHAFEYVDARQSYEKNRFLSFDLGLGYSDFINTKNIATKPGFGLRVGLGHPFSKFLYGELYYQLGVTKFQSPDPVDSDLTLESTATMHQEVFRILLKDFRVAAMPYLSIGVGSYQFTGLDSKTSLAFPAALQIPIGAGLKAYILKDIISFNADFSYHFVFGENQSQSVLSTLGRNKVGFDFYSLMLGFEFHCF